MDRPAATTTPRAPEAVELTLTEGRVRGIARDGVRTVLDVPYAAAPIAERRFAAPEPHPPWTGVRDGARPGPNAPQPPRSRFGDLDLRPFFAPGWVPGDDHLTVNVWAPEPPREPAPVLVWVHGGAFVAGSNRAPAYDGSAFARDGVVVVAVNYRLGAAGFLHLPDAPANRGCLDVLAALRWVRANASALGGDPDRVTLAGQSAGAVIVGAVLASGAGRGLFRRAIVQSGTGDAAFSTEQAERVTHAVAAATGATGTAAGLARVPDGTLVDALAGLAGLDLRTATDPAPIGGIVTVGPVMEVAPADALAGASDAPATELLIGSNRDEAALYLGQQPPVGSLAELRASLEPFGVDQAALVDAYRAADPSMTLTELRTVIAGDGMFGVGTRRLAEAHAGHGRPTWLYELGWRSDALAGRLRASHLMELPLVFGTLGLAGLHGKHALLGDTPPPVPLARRVHDAWVAFVRTGDPGWGAFRPQAPTLARIDTVWTETEAPGPRDPVRAAWR